MNHVKIKHNSNFRTLSPLQGALGDIPEGYSTECVNVSSTVAPTLTKFLASKLIITR